jgi:hypothetical protein
MQQFAASAESGRSHAQFRKSYHMCQGTRRIFTLPGFRDGQSFREFACNQIIDVKTANRLHIQYAAEPESVTTGFSVFSAVASGMKLARINAVFSILMAYPLCPGSRLNFYISISLHKIILHTIRYREKLIRIISMHQVSVALQRKDIMKIFSWNTGRRWLVMVFSVRNSLPRFRSA